MKAKTSISLNDIFWFWVPLFASWMLMTAEGPIISAAINRLPEEVVMLAAQGIVISLSVMIQSPIINMLATSTATVKDLQSFRLVRRFTLHWMILLTSITLLVAFTPLFDVVVRGGLDVPEEVAVWVRPGLQIMTLWSAVIAWRRFLQGVMISFGQTRLVAWGTAVRMGVVVAALLLLTTLTDWPGAIIGATALISAVSAEALYATVAIRPVLRNMPENEPEAELLTYRDLFWFHLPLAGTSVLVLLVQPLVTFALARLANPTESLAAWPVLFQLTLMGRAAALALPEVIIALSKRPGSFQPLRRFSLLLGLLITALTLIFIATPLASGYLFVVQDMTTVVGELTLVALPLFLFFPALTTLTSWLRGLLIHEKQTAVINRGMGVNVLLTAVILAIGLLLQQPGLPTAAVALNVSAVAEVAYLALRGQKVLHLPMPLFGRPQPAPVSGD